nr:hypothetical protein 74 [bacterium]
MSFILGANTGCASDVALGYAKTEYVSPPPVYPEGDIPELWIESFVQPDVDAGIDIIWLLDTSGSMSDNYEAEIAGIGAMMEALPVDIEWRLVMTSTDPGDAQTEEWSVYPGYLGPFDDIEDAEHMFSEIGENAGEMGFDALYNYVEHNSFAKDWMRPEGQLLAVFVSDEEEQSTDLSAVSDFVEWYTGLRYAVHLASIVHVEDDSNCETFSSNVGSRYIEATEELGGIIVDICSDDWGPGVTDASTKFEPYNEWPLTWLPVSETISVFISGSPDTNWYYEPGENKVVFTVTPSASSLVEIAYQVLLEEEDG